MCLFGGKKAAVKAPEVPRPADPEGRAASMNLAEQRKRAARYGSNATTLTSSLGVSNFGSASRAVTVLGRAA